MSIYVTGGAESDELDADALEAASVAINRFEDCFVHVQARERRWAQIAIETYLAHISRK